MNEDGKTADASNQTSTPADAGDNASELVDRDLRNENHLRRVIEKREMWQQKALTYESQIEELQNEVKELTKAKKKTEGEYKSLYEDAMKQIEDWQGKHAEIEGRFTELQTKTLTTTFFDVALKETKNRDKGTLLLRGLAAEGKINLAPSEEEREEEASKARGMLEEMEPSLFVADARKANSQGVIPNQPTKESKKARPFGGPGFPSLY